jgi:hypothetical protein
VELAPELQAARNAASRTVTIMAANLFLFLFIDKISSLPDYF